MSKSNNRIPSRLKTAMKQAGIHPTWKCLAELFDIQPHSLYKKIFHANLTYIERFIYVAEALSLTPRELLEIIKECRKANTFDVAPNVVPPIEKLNFTPIERSVLFASENVPPNGEKKIQTK